MIRRLLTFCFCSVCLGLFVLCSLSPLSNNGGGTDFPNTRTVAVIGQVVDSLGGPVSQTRVMLLPALYNPMTGPAVPDSMIGVTDEAGYYALKAPGPGAYSVEATDGNSKCKALVTGITINKEDTVTVRESVLLRPGVLRVVLPDTGNEAYGYVYLSGTTCYARTSHGIVVVTAVPAGLIPAVYYANTAAPAKNHVVQTNVTVPSNDTLLLSDTTGWKYAKKLYCNITAGGAGIGQNVYGFPVLVRLTSDNFDFSQARSEGGDVWFTKPDQAPLPYEIERWDATQQAAAIWVKVDTVYGNDSSHFIAMYWGNPDAANHSNGSAIFDTVDGFSGVWHLGETGNSSVDGYADATPNAAHGQGTNLSAGSETQAVISRGQNLKYSTSSYIAVNPSAEPKFDITGAITVSAWINVTSWTAQWQTIISKGDSAWRFHRRGSDGYLEFVCNGLSNDSSIYYVRGSSTLSTGTNTPYYVTAVYDGSHLYMYLNGKNDAAPVAATGSINTNGYTVTIGENGQYTGRSFNGVIDEVRVEKVARSADWIKLCYMNQKEQDALVEFR